MIFFAKKSIFVEVSEFRKYILNPETLLFEIKEVSLKYKFFKSLALLIGSMALAFLYMWIYTAVFKLDLPKTALLKKANARWLSKVEIMDHNMDRMDDALASLQILDNDIYRPIFGMVPIASSVRNAGIGGPERYSSLDDIYDGGLLKGTAIKLDILANKTSVQSISFDEVSSISRRAGDMVSCIPAIPPVNPDPRRYRLTSPFGYRSDPINGVTTMHSGMDFAFPPGNPVYATGDGVVESVNFEFYGYGNCVIIDHGFGYKTRYAHMKEIGVVEGMKIKRGDCLGESGKTGKVTGPHLHYEVIYMGVPVNPVNYMNLDMSPKDYAAMVNRDRQEDQPAVKPFSLRRRK